MSEENFIQKIDNEQNELNHVAIKIALSSLGPIGAAIDEVLFGIGDRIRMKRFEKFIKTLELKINEIDQTKIDQKFLNSEEFYDLNIKIFSAALKTRHFEKHQILSKIFTNELVHSYRWNEDISDILIRLVDEFSLGHIYVFRFFVNNIELLSEAESYEQLYEKFIGLKEDNKIELYEFRLFCRDLENKTLLRFSKNINEIGSSGGYIAMEDYSEISGIQITPIGQKFISVLL